MMLLVYIRNDTHEIVNVLTKYHCVWRLFIYVQENRNLN